MPKTIMQGIELTTVEMSIILPRRTSPEPASGTAQTTKAGSAAEAFLGTGGGDAVPADDQHPKSVAGAPPKHPRTPKRTLTRDNFFKTVANFARSSPILVRAAVRPRVSSALREKIFLAVTVINDCRYCRWGHSHWAMAHGVPMEEVNRILRHQTESLEAKNPAEAVAILFAQHYAEQLDQCDPESIENLRRYYRDAEVAEILAYVRLITLMNLTGNTVDAFLTGTHGKGDAICTDGKEVTFRSNEVNSQERTREGKGVF